MNHFLFFAVLLCAFLGSALSQNRGSVRYEASAYDEEHDAERAQRVPPRRTSVRRARITPLPEAGPLHEETQTSPPTSSRRIPKRDHFVPSRAAQPVVEEVHVPLIPSLPDEPHIPDSPPENKQQNRRRKQKKRRKPLNASSQSEKDILKPEEKIFEEKSNQPITTEEENLSPNHNIPSFRNEPKLAGDVAKVDYVDSSLNENAPIDTPEAYYSPEAGENRLPIAENPSEHSPREYSEHSPAVSARGEIPSRHVTSRPEVNHSPQRGSYVPILSPNRGSAPQQANSYQYERENKPQKSQVQDTRSSYKYGRDNKPSDTLNRGSSNHPIDSNKYERDNKPSETPLSRQNTVNNRSPLPINSEDYIRSTNARPLDNVIIGSNEPGVPIPSHGEVRLPLSENPLIAPENDKLLVNNAETSYESNEESLNRGDSDETPNSRFQESSETDYEPNHPSHSREIVDESIYILPNRRPEARSFNSRNALSSHSSENEEPKPRRSNAPSIDERKLSVYQPPLQRSGSRYKPTDSEIVPNPRQPAAVFENSEEQPPTRRRSTSRYQPENLDSDLSRARVSSRPNSENIEHVPVRSQTSSRGTNQPTRSQSASRTQNDYVEYERSRPRQSSPQSNDNSRQAPVTRGSSRYQPEEVSNEPSRVVSRSRSSSRSRVISPENQEHNIRGHYSEPEEENSRRSPINPEANIDAEYSSADRIYRQRVRATPSPVSHEGDTEEEYGLADQNYHRINRNPVSPVNPVNHDAAEYSTADKNYRQINRVIPRPDNDSPRRERTRTTYRTSRPEEPVETPPRHSRRPQPQAVARQPEQPYTYEGPVDNGNEYEPEYLEPGQGNRRIPSPREQPVVARQRVPSHPREEAEHTAPPTRHQSEHQVTRQRNPPHVSEEAEHGIPPQRHQPQNQTPQNSRRQPATQRARQPQPETRYQEPPQSPRNRYQEPPQTPRNRHQEVPASPRQERPSGGSRFRCPEPYGFFADSVQCDKYYECRNGTAVEGLCDDGLAFNDENSPKYLRCDSIRDVNCQARPELQEPRPTKNCPRRYGLFPHETDCTKFWNCVDGTATEVKCPPGLTYNDERATCDWADLVKTSCKTEDLLGFTCPEPTPYDLQDGVYTRYPHPDNCQLHFTCIKGEDGLRRPRMLSCNEGLVFDPESSSCRRPEEVAGCEDFYGSRSPPPKRKPAREPQPEDYSAEEEPTPKPRRRNTSRRSRN